MAGVPLAWLTHSIAMVPTLIVVGIGIGVFVGGDCCASTSAVGPTPGCTASSVAARAAPPRAGGPRGRWAAHHLLGLVGHAAPAPRPPRHTSCGCSARGTDGTQRQEGHPVSRFRNEVMRLQAHVKTLRLSAAALFVVALLLDAGWWSAPKSLTIHVPPDLRSEQHPQVVGGAAGERLSRRSTSGSRPSAGQPMARRTTRATCARCPTISRRAAGPSCSRTTSTGAATASCASACAASTRFRAAATAATRHRASRYCPPTTGSSRWT